MNRRHGRPTPDDLRAWHEVARTVTPIGRRAPKPGGPEETASTDEGASGRKVGPPKPVAKAPPPPRGSSAPALDRRTAARVARGRIDIDATVDLHGLTQAAAHRRLASFLHHAQADGARMVLVITGKGSPQGGGADGERGVLRRVVPQWLNAAEMRPYVVGFGEAGRRHGRGGALYVQIRRPRR